MKVYNDEMVCSYIMGECDYSDEVNGFSIHLATLYDKETFGETKSGFRSTPLVLYVVGTNTRRAGTDSDRDIVKSMLDRGYIVTVADFGDDENATTPKIDWTINALIQKIKAGEYLEGDCFAKGFYVNTYIVPAGHNLSINNIFWEIDKYSVVGTLEKIVYNWNTDLRGCKGEFIIPWVHKDGTRKATQTDFDGGAPVWYADAQGQIPDATGSYIRLKHTKAEKITHPVFSN